VFYLDLNKMFSFCVYVYEFGVNAVVFWQSFNSIGLEIFERCKFVPFDAE